jgi:hypothetical protein
MFILAAEAASARKLVVRLNETILARPFAAD